jgi:Tfp pilus assembly protein PilF
MRTTRAVAAAALLIGACAPTVQERVRDYNEDGVFLYKQGDYAHARESFQAALALQPGDVNLLYNLAQCHDRLGHDTQAESTYRDCLVRSPDNAQCRFALARLLIRQGRRQDAVQMTEEWLKRNPRQAGPYAVDGWLWEQYGDLPKAQSRFQQALTFDPHDNLAITELARLYELMSRPDRAAALYEKALDAQPDQPEVLDRLTALRKQGAARPHPD